MPSLLMLTTNGSEELYDMLCAGSDGCTGDVAAGDGSGARGGRACIATANGVAVTGMQRWEREGMTEKSVSS